MKLETSILYQVNPDHIVDIYTAFGKNYDFLLDPQLRNEIQTIISKYQVKKNYSRDLLKEMMSKELKEELKRFMENKGFIIEEVDIQNLLIDEEIFDKF